MELDLSQLNSNVAEIFYLVKMHYIERYEDKDTDEYYIYRDRYTGIPIEKLIGINLGFFSFDEEHGIINIRYENEHISNIEVLESFNKENKYYHIFNSKFDEIACKRFDQMRDRVRELLEMPSYELSASTCLHNFPMWCLPLSDFDDKKTILEDFIGVKYETSDKF